jgi:hypothetical protein
LENEDFAITVLKALHYSGAVFCPEFMPFRVSNNLRCQKMILLDPPIISRCTHWLNDQVMQRLQKSPQRSYSLAAYKFSTDLLLRGMLAGDPDQLPVIEFLEAIGIFVSLTDESNSPREKVYLALSCMDLDCDRKYFVEHKKICNSVLYIDFKGLLPETLASSLLIRLIDIEGLVHYRIHNRTCADYSLDVVDYTAYVDHVHDVV